MYCTLVNYKHVNALDCRQCCVTNGSVLQSTHDILEKAVIYIQDLKERHDLFLQEKGDKVQGMKLM